MRLRLAQRRTRADKRIRWGGWANGRWRRRPKGFKSDPGPSSPVNYSFFLRKEKIGAPHFKTMRNLLVKLLWVAPAPPNSDTSAQQLMTMRILVFQLRLRDGLGLHFLFFLTHCWLRLT